MRSTCVGRPTDGPKHVLFVRVGHIDRWIEPLKATPDSWGQIKYSPAGQDDLSVVLRDIRTILGHIPCHVIRTKNGAHVLVQTRLVDARVKPTFYQDLKESNEEMDGMVEIGRDAMVPIPDNAQGNVMPRLLDDVPTGAGGQPAEGKPG